MTKQLPKPNVQVRARRTGPPRLTSAERQQLESVQDPTLKKVLGEIFLAARANQDNFDEISQWFPIQPADASDSLREGDELNQENVDPPDLEPIELEEEDHTVGNFSTDSVVAWLREKLWKSWIEAYRTTGSLYHTIRLVSRWGTSGQAALEVRGSDDTSILAGSKTRVLAKVGEEAVSILESEFGGVAARSDFSRWKGEWKNTTAYGEGMVVRRAGISYICKKAHTNQEPPNAEYWEVFGTGEKGAAGEKGAEGRWASLRYAYLTNTEETEPAAGKLKFNAGKTALYISETDGDGGGIGAYLATWDDSTTTGTRGFIVLRKIGTPATFAIYKVTGALVDKGTWDTLPVELVSSNGVLGNEDPLSVEFYRTGDKGDAGEKGEAGAKGEKGEAGTAGEKGEVGGDIEQDSLVQSAAGTGTLEWEHEFTTVDKVRGVLVLIVADDATPSDEVTAVTFGGKTMEEVPLSPFLHTLGTEDGVIYGYFLGARDFAARSGGVFKVTVSGATSKRAVSIALKADEELRVEATDTDDAAGAETPGAVLTIGRNECIAFGALHSGNDAPATLGAGSNTTKIAEHDFGTTSAAWYRRATGNGPGTIEVAATQTSDEAGFLGVAIGRIRDHGLVTALPTVAGKGDRCSYIADSANGVIWRLVYDGEGEFPWKKVGGPPLVARSDTARTRNNAVYGALPTDPLSLTAPLKGDYDMTIEAEIYNEANAREAFLSYAIGATAANDNWCADVLVTTTAFGAASVSCTTRQKGVAAAAKVEEQARTNGGQCRFNRRRLRIDPVRVG